MEACANSSLNLKQIAKTLGKSQSTVRTQLYMSLRKLEVHDRVSGVMVCIRNGWIVLDDWSGAEALLLTRIEQLLSDLVVTIENRNEREPLTDVQRKYLQTFRRYLNGPAYLSKARREQMSAQALFVLQEANVKHLASQDPSR